LSPTFDQILGIVQQALTPYSAVLATAEWWFINRDLFGRVRLIAPAAQQAALEASEAFRALTRALSEPLGAHGYPADVIVLFEDEPETVLDGTTAFELDGFPGVRVVDRLASESDWGHVAEVSTGPPRIVFHGIKGGVGRSTAIAVTAAVLAERGHRVIVVDLDLASPGLSSTLLPIARRPKHGVVDWLVEDLVDNGDVVLDSMVTRSGFESAGEIIVVPAHGDSPGEYLAKLGRVWMPKLTPTGREKWARRLNRMLGALETRWRPDVVLVDSRSGIDDISAACVTELGALRVLMFTTDAPQTWEGYRILFDHWRRTGSVTCIRERLQCVGAAMPSVDEARDFLALREMSWSLFVEGVYDEIPVPSEGSQDDDFFSYDVGDRLGPHFPWQVRWDRAFLNIAAWHEAFGVLDGKVIDASFGPVIDGISALIVEHQNGAPTIDKEGL